jgi:DNA adenine methylase
MLIQYWLLVMVPPRAETVLTPFLKWAGGKRWFVANYSHLLPKSFGRYFEPFLGSGAVFFHLRPAKAVLSDTNAELVTAYKTVRSDWKKIRELLITHQARHSREHFYSVRAAKYVRPAEQAARLLYLNRTCWNGLYRVNLSGRFNVPMGTKNTVLFEREDFRQLASVLRRARLRVQDFEVSIDSAQRNDFVFLDPPYTVSHNNNGFIKYNDRLFSWDDQIRLRDSVARAVRRGVKILLTNANHDAIRRLYRGVGSLSVVTRPGILAADASRRRPVEELVFRAE